MSPTKTCCLHSLWIASRVLSASPLAVFQCRALQTALFEGISGTWQRKEGDDRSPLAGARQRTACLAAIELLVNHPDADVSSFFVKTLVPQVSRWCHP